MSWMDEGGFMQHYFSLVCLFSSLKVLLNESFLPV
jgi:hypothetical protein